MSPLPDPTIHDARPVAGGSVRRGRRRRFIDAICVAAIFVVSSVLYLSTAPEGLELRDEGHMLVLSRQMLEGEVPHRDTIDVYGPGVYEVIAATLDIGDGKILFVRKSLAVLRAGAVVMAYLLSRYFMPVPFALLTAALSMAYWGRMTWNLNVPYAALYTIPLCMCSSLLLLESIRRDSRRWYFLTGFVAGVVVLFKQSLGIMNIYCLVVALWIARAVIDEVEEPRRSRLFAATFVPAFIAAIVGMLPFVRFLNRQDYLLHFAPAHALLAIVAASCFFRKKTPAPGRLLLTSWLPAGAGVLAALGPVVAVYAYWGALDTLVADMIVLPTKMQSYYAGVWTPPRALTYTVIAVVCGCSAAMFAIARRPLAAASALAVAGIAAVAARHKFGPMGFATWSPEFWSRSLDAYASTLLFVGSVLTLAAMVVSMLSPTRAPVAPKDVPTGAKRTLAMLSAFVFMQQVFAFQIFPRDAFNAFVIQGAVVPLTGYALWRWHSLVLGSNAPKFARAAAFVLVLVIPVWLVNRIAFATLASATVQTRLPIDIEVAEGLGFASASPEYARASALAELVRHLERITTPETKLVLLTNEEMILYASRLRHALPESEFYYFLAGWGMLRDEPDRPMATSSAAERLDREASEVLVIDRGDAASQNIRKYDPVLASYVDAKFEVSEVVAGYRILRRRPAVAGG
jgi:hypothetical protein